MQCGISAGGHSEEPCRICLGIVTLRAEGTGACGCSQGDDSPEVQRLPVCGPIKQKQLGMEVTMRELTQVVSHPCGLMSARSGNIDSNVEVLIQTQTGDKYYYLSHGMEINHRKEVQHLGAR